MKRRYLIALGAVAAGIAAAIAIALTGSGRGAHGIFWSVSTKTLAAGGLRSDGLMLTAAHGRTPSAANGRAAARTASKQFSSKVLEYHYVHCRDQTVDEDCWAVSLDPSALMLGGGAPPGFPAQKKASYLVVLISSVGHAFIEGVEG